MLLALIPAIALADRPYCGKIECLLPQKPVNGIIATEVSCGSFVIVGPNHVLTNHHVVEDYLNKVKEGGEGIIRLTFQDGSHRGGEVVDHRKEHDLALVRFPGTLNPGLHRIKVGADWPNKQVTVGGYPGCGPYQEQTKTGFAINPNFVTSFSFRGIYPSGYSGSPIINERGELCGLLWGCDWHPDNPGPEYYGYGTRIEFIRSFLQKNDLLFD